MYLAGYETVGLVIDILICCALLFVILKVERYMAPSRAVATGPSAKTPAKKTRSAPSRNPSTQGGSPNRYDEVVALASRGLPREAIARRLGMTGGEVSLVLDLDRSRNDQT